MLRVKRLNSNSVRKVQCSSKGATTLAKPTFTHTSSKNREKQRGQRKGRIFFSSLPPPLLKAITYQCLSVLSSFLCFLLLVRIRFSISFFIADNIYIERDILLSSSPDPFVSHSSPTFSRILHFLSDQELRDVLVLRVKAPSLKLEESRIEV
ncbi:hypothetical protein IMY05_003G0158000 [Salix suchowensis]|nr:hypothetical protein IMY05_003G0158000 [Salix suchowensis]